MLSVATHYLFRQWVVFLLQILGKEKDSKMRLGAFSKIGTLGGSIDEESRGGHKPDKPTISVAPKYLFLSKSNEYWGETHVMTKPEVQWNAF